MTVVRRLNPLVTSLVSAIVRAAHRRRTVVLSAIAALLLVSIAGIGKTGFRPPRLVGMDAQAARRSVMTGSEKRFTRSPWMHSALSPDAFGQGFLRGNAARSAKPPDGEDRTDQCGQSERLQ